jgi:multicomponent Na+:H+ antiporter subunit C
VSVSLVLLVVMAVMFACGVFLLLERSMTRVLLGFLLVGNATNLLILIMGGVAGVAPIVEDGVETGEMSDPLPQALILTAIVITFGVSAFLMALIYRSWRLSKDDDVDDDADDVALREFTEGLLADEDGHQSSDTEFGTRAEAAVTEAIDLDTQDSGALARVASDAVPPTGEDAR